MNANLRKLHDTGQRVWLDHITRELRTSGRLASYISAFSVSGLTSNPTLFEHAIASAEAYDETLHDCAARGLSAEEIDFELALQDLTQAADLLRPIFDASAGADGWVSLEVSPLASPRWKTLAAAGAPPQRLLWASTGSKDKTVADTRPSGTEDIYKIYVESFRGEEHLHRIANEAQAIVDADIGAETALT